MGLTLVLFGPILLCIYIYTLLVEHGVVTGTLTKVKPSVTSNIPHGEILLDPGHI